MTKQQLIKLAGSQSELARLLGISKPAVCQWKAQIPELRLRQLKDLKPDWFLTEETWKKHWLQFGLQHQPQRSGRLAQRTPTTPMAGMSPAPPVAMGTTATQTAIEVWLFETRLGWKSWANRKENRPLLPRFLFQGLVEVWKCTTILFTLVITSTIQPI